MNRGPGKPDDPWMNQFVKQFDSMNFPVSTFAFKMAVKNAVPIKP